MTKNCSNCGRELEEEYKECQCKKDEQIFQETGLLMYG